MHTPLWLGSITKNVIASSLIQWCSYKCFFHCYSKILNACDINYIINVHQRWGGTYWHSRASEIYNLAATYIFAIHDGYILDCHIVIIHLCSVSCCDTLRVWYCYIHIMYINVHVHVLVSQVQTQDDVHELPKGLLYSLQYRSLSQLVIMDALTKLCKPFCCQDDCSRFSTNLNRKIVT